MEITESKIIKVLLIEDNVGDARLIHEQLKEVPEITFQLECVSLLQEGLDYLANHQIDIILSDLSLPDSPGLETFKRLQTQISKVPVIVLTGFDNKSVALEAVRDGAQDYLIKGQVEGKTLSRLILYAIERYRTQANLRSQSLTDPLTGLYNRRGLITLGEQVLKVAYRTKTSLYLFFADLDGLKKINDTYGHKEGDQAIIQTARVLQKTFRESDILARLGGDEFVILATPDQQTQPEHLMIRLQENLKQHNLQKAQAYQLSLSMGAAQFDPAHASSMEELLAKADELLYSQKKERKGLAAAFAHRKVWRLLGAVSLLTFLGLLWSYPRVHQAVILPPPPPVIRHPSPPLPKQSAMEVPVVKKLAPPAAPKSPAPSNEIHKELIPKDIAIVRFYYDQQVVSPGTTFGFDINGSGFTSEFQKSLSVNTGEPTLQVKNLHLVTANQIHGDLIVAPGAATHYVFPRVSLKNRPVFQAPQPFAVIRPGEVLDIVFTRLDEDGRGGGFRIFTYLDPTTAKLFHLKAGASGLEISALKPRLPFIMEGTLRLGEGVDHGDYDLIAFLGSKEVFRKRQMLHIVSPNVGQGGLIQSLKAAEFNHRPGDNVELLLQGTGFAPQDIEALNARIDEIDMGKLTYTFISSTQLGIYFTVPKEAPEGPYGILIEQNHQLLWRQKKVFSIVPANWVTSVQMTPVSPGDKALLKVTGRDFSGEFEKGLKIQVDEPGIYISSLRRMDSYTLAADVEVESSVVPGDYLLNLTFKGTVVKPQTGSIITVRTP